MKGGFYPLDPEWGKYLIALFKPSETPFRFLDPFAGEGAFGVQFCEALNGEAYMVENDELRARKMQEKIGVVRGAWSDSYKMSISHDAFPLVWLNPPFDNEMVDSYSNKSRRAEYLATHHFRRYLQDGGFLILTCYLQHMSKHIFELFFRRCNFVHIYRFPEEHLDRYTQIVIIGQLRKGGETKNEAWMEENFPRFEALRNNPEKIKDISLVIHHKSDGIDTAKIRTKSSPEPFYEIPANRPIKKLMFVPEKMDIKVLAGLNKRHGAQVDPDFGRIILPHIPEAIERPKHKPLELQVPVIIQSGLFDGLRVMYQGKKSLIRGSVQREVIDVKIEELPADDQGKDRQVITTHNRPLSKLTILSEDGKVEEIDEDHILEFAAEFRDQLMQYYTDNYQPTFDMTIHPVWAKMLDRIRFNEGKSKPWAMQRYVITCIAEDMMFNQGNVPIGEPGVGKTGIMTSVTLFLRMLEMAKIVYRAKGTCEVPSFAAYYDITNEELLDLIENLKRRYLSHFKPTKRRHYLNSMQGLPVDRPVMIVCPATLPMQWIAEIKGVYPDANVEWLVNTSQTHKFFDEALQNTDGARMDFAITTYERAKLGSGWTPAYNIEYSKQTLLKTTERDKDGAPVMVIKHVPRTIDPVTGGRIIEYGARGESFVPPKRLESKQQQYFYIGGIFDGYEWVRDISNPDVKKQHKVLKKFKLRSVEEYTFQTSRSHGFACWQQARPPGDVPKIGNGVCEFHYEEIELGLDNTFGGDPKTGYGAYAPLVVKTEKRFNRDIGEYEYIPVSISNYGRTKKRVYQEKVFDRGLWDGEEYPDKWLAMQGIRPFTENKNRKMTSLLKKHGLKQYVLGGGIKEIDLVMQDLDISEYRLGGGSREFKNVRYALADFIKALYRVRFKFGKNIQKPIGFLIADEFHMAKAASSDVGIATRSLMDSSICSAGATGTLYSGKASSVYPILFTLSKSVQREYRWVRGMPIHWIIDMGVLKQEFEERADYTRYGAYAGHKRYPKGSSTEAPGISPLLVRRVIPVAEFFGLRDAGAVMRPYKEVPIEIPMDALMRTTYDYWYNELREYNAKCIMNGDGSFTASYYQNLYLLPDAMHRTTEVHHRTVVDRDTGKKDDIIVFEIPSIGEYAKPKEVKMIELLNQHLDAGDRIIVSTNQSSTRDIQPHLMALIEKNCPKAKPFIMQEKETGKRLAYIKQKVSEGNNIMITNPKKVATGLNLIMFNVMVAMDVSQELQIMAQFVKRCHRPTQPRPYVTVYYLYYDDVFQNKAVSDLADKVAANDVLNGAGRGNLAKMSKTVTDYEEMGKVLFGDIEKFKKLTQEQMREKFKTMELNPDDYKKSPWYVEEGEVVEHMSEDEAFEFEREFEDEESQNGSEDFVEGEFEEVGEQLALPPQVQEEEIFHEPKKKVSRKEVIARLNDQARQALNCRVLLTEGIQAYPEEDQREIMRLVQNFTDFKTENDPYGEHDFGSFDYKEEKIYWKFDYYDLNYEYGSEDAADATKTKRVLTILFASEY